MLLDTADFVRRESDPLTNGTVVTVRLDRAPTNALSRRVVDELCRVARDVSGDAQVRAVVLCGGAKNFCSGLDRAEFARNAENAASDALRVQESLAAVADLDVPVVAAITGYALGGGLELALCADVRVAGDNVRLGDGEFLREMRTGGRGQRLVRQVGASRAQDLIFSGRHLTAAEALSWGLLDHVVAPDDVHSAALELARQYARRLRDTEGR